MIKRLISATLFTLAAHAAPSHAATSLTSGWNLIGNGTDQAISASAIFGDNTKYVSVWKWNSTSGTWAFYAPSLSESALKTYAASKGYEVLSTINSKEGFWVNANVATVVSSTGISQNGSYLSASDLKNGWNLVASADAKTPADLNTSLSTSLTAANLSMTSAWAWDPSTSSWKFYAPSLDAQSSTALADYIKSKNYLAFTSALKMSDGFWLNMGAATSTPSTTAGQSAIAYATSLKAALDLSQTTIQTELDSFNLSYQNKVIPSMETLNRALGLIDGQCQFNQSSVSVTCTTGAVYLDGGSITLSGSANNYTYKGTVNSKTVSGTMTFTPSDANTFSVNFSGTIPHPVSGGNPATVNLIASFNLDQTTLMSGGVTISQATVTFPAYLSSAEGTLTLTNGLAALELRNGNVYQNCSTWPCTIQIDTSATPLAGMPKKITGKLSFTTDNGDVVSGDLTANFVVPEQSVWTALSKEKKFGIKDNPPIEDISFTAKLAVKNGKSYSVNATLNPDYTNVDFSKAYSSTNFATGYMQFVLDMGNSGTSSLVKLDMRIDRVNYTAGKPTIKLYTGTYDVLTIVPNNTANTYAINTTTYWVNPYNMTDWLVVESINNGLSDGVKITTLNSSYVTTLTKSTSSSAVNGIVMNGTTQVGEIKNGLLYLDGKIFALN